MERIRQAYEKVYDEETDTYFYFNKLKGTSHWNGPKILRGRPLDPRVRTVALCLFVYRPRIVKCVALLRYVFDAGAKKTRCNACSRPA